MAKLEELDLRVDSRGASDDATFWVSGFLQLDETETQKLNGVKLKFRIQSVDEDTHFDDDLSRFDHEVVFAPQGAPGRKFIPTVL